jgi:hypothetical protein
MYYLRTRPKADAIAFTVDQAMAAKSRGENALKPVNTEPEECLSCGAFVRGVLFMSSPRHRRDVRSTHWFTHTGKNRRVPPFPPILT